MVMVNYRRSIICLIRSILLLTIFFISSRAQATTVVMLSDEDLIVSSRAIVRGKVTAVESLFDDSHTRVYSYITVEIKSLLKGKIDSRRIVIRQLGGRIDDFSQIIYGAPEFKLGEQVLLYLNTADDGALRVA